MTAPTLSYTVTRTISINIDVTPDELLDAVARGERLAEYAAAVADVQPASAWTVADETVMPSYPSRPSRPANFGASDGPMPEGFTDEEEW